MNTNSICGKKKIPFILYYTYIHDKAKGRKLGKISGNIKNSRLEVVNGK